LPSLTLNPRCMRASNFANSGESHARGFPGLQADEYGCRGIAPVGGAQRHLSTPLFPA
jgi:hypothetical protein